MNSCVAGYLAGHRFPASSPDRFADRNCLYPDSASDADGAFQSFSTLRAWSTAMIETRKD